MNTDTKLPIKIATWSVVVIAVISIIGIIIFKDSPTILQGEIECTQIKISGKLLGRIDSLYVNEGDFVNKGDTLVLINSPETDALMQSASAMKDVADFQNLKIDAGARKQIIESLKEAWIAAKAQAELAAATNERIERLYRDSVVTLQRKEESQALAKAAKAAEAVAKYQYEMALEGAQKEDKESAKAMADAAYGDVMAVKALLHDSKLTAPESGQISSIYPTIGELVMPGTPIMDIIVIENCYAVLNIREDLMGQFKIGDIFKGRIPALNNSYIRFKIFYINPLGSFANWNSSKEDGSYNIVTFQIKAKPVESENKNGNAIAGLRPGMSVLVELD